ncbi:MAG: hypothetical protein QF464_20180, partial [Myxococcota bacterium]|nr:hypothetical protein [Myxococcota bacterium]
MADSEPTRLRGLAVPVDAPPQSLRRQAAEAMGLPVEALAEVRPVKVSLDARAKTPKHVYTVDVWRIDQVVPPASVLAPRRA